MIACKFCGFWNLEPTVFCTHCGRRIVQPKSSKLNWLLLIACVILLILVIASHGGWLFHLQTG
jgi:uncharacterized paraquat-inducible protein A